MKRRGLCRPDCGCEGPWECERPKRPEPQRHDIHVHLHHEPRSVGPVVVAGEVIDEEVES